MGERGVDPIEVTEDDRAYTREKAALGATFGSILRRLGYSAGSHKVRDQLREDFKAGIEEANEKVAGVAFENAMDPDAKFQASRFFWLKTQARWRENHRLEVTGADGGPVRTLDLSKLTDDDLARIEPILARLAASDDASGTDQGGTDEADGEGEG